MPRDYIETSETKRSLPLLPDLTVANADADEINNFINRLAPKILTLYKAIDFTQEKLDAHVFACEQGTSQEPLFKSPAPVPEADEPIYSKEAFRLLYEARLRVLSADELETLRLAGIMPEEVAIPILSLPPDPAPHEPKGGFCGFIGRESQTGRR